jgi:hypothetical protein
VPWCLGADAALMAEHHRLTDQGRIAFTTFHQSMSHEDFVEGLRPDTAASDPGPSDLPDDTAQGFRLRVEDGLFKQISRRTEASRGRRTPGEILNLQGCQVFKTGRPWRVCSWPTAFRPPARARRKAQRCGSR